MKLNSNSALLWTHLKLPAIVLAVLAVASPTQAQTTFTPVFSKVWDLPAGTYNDMTNRAEATATTTRGAAISPTTTNVLYASTYAGTNNGVPHVSTVSFASGSNFLAGLSGSGVSGGTGVLIGTRVADDGTVYAINLSGGPTSVLKIYKWPSETDINTAPVNVSTVVSGSSFQWRLGDYMDLRGSGAATEIVVVGNGSGANVTTNFAIFRPTDATCTSFTNFTLTVPGSFIPNVVTNNYCGGGVAFEGTNNAIWIRRTDFQETRHITYNPATMTAVTDRTNTVDQSVCQGLKYYKAANGVELLATVQINKTANTIQIARVFQIPSSPTGPLTSVLSSNLPVVTGSQNANGLGNVDARNGYFVFGAPGHGLSLFSVNFQTNSPPTSPNLSLTLSTAVSGYGYNSTLTGTAAGSVPLSYQFFFTNGVTTNALNAMSTNNVFTVSNLASANAGSYFFIVTNLYGRATSSVSSITVLPNGASSFATNLWSLAPGSRPYLTGGDFQRGMAYDANSNRVVLVSRVSHAYLTDTNFTYPYGVFILDANTGAEIGECDLSVLWNLTPAGTFPINMCGVADDGIIYVANLITSADSSTFAIYTIPSADPAAALSGTPAYYANPMGAVYPGSGALGRIGDTMAVRGAGTNTQILCPFRNGTNVCIFTTADGFNFDAHVIAVTNLSATAGLTDPFSGASPLGLGCAFGSGDTFWAKSANYNLRQVSFNLEDNTAAVIASHAISGTSAPLGVNNVGGYVGIIGHAELPMNLALYDINKTANLTTAGISDRELLGLGTNSVANGNGTGAVGFDTVRGRAFALSSNNGLLALQVNPATAAATAVPQGGTITWSGPGILQSATTVDGIYADVLGAVSPYTNTGAAQLFFRVKR